MQEQKQKEDTAPDTMYILATIQMSNANAYVKRTGFFIGFGGAQGQMIGLENNEGHLAFFDSSLYSVTQISWNFGKKYRLKFFTPMEKNPALDKHVKSEALDFLKKLWGYVTRKKDIKLVGYYNKDRIYKNAPEDVDTEVIAESKEDEAKQAPATRAHVTTSPSYPDGNNQETKGTPEAPKTTSNTSSTTAYKKRVPTMFSRKSTDRVKARILFISKRLDELIAAAAEAEKAEEDDSNTKGSQHTAAPAKQLGQQVKEAREKDGRDFSKFCQDCIHRWSCSRDVWHMAYCSRKEKEDSFSSSFYPI